MHGIYLSANVCVYDLYNHNCIYVYMHKSCLDTENNQSHVLIIDPFNLQ